MTDKGITEAKQLLLWIMITGVISVGWNFEETLRHWFVDGWNEHAIKHLASGSLWAFGLWCWKRPFYEIFIDWRSSLNK